VEDTIINRDGKTCWMWSRNLQVTKIKDESL
jgi:hypothetical protein